MGWEGRSGKMKEEVMMMIDRRGNPLILMGNQIKKVDFFALDSMIT